MNTTPSEPGRPLRFSRQFRLKSPLVIRQILQDRTSRRRRFDGFRVVSSSGKVAEGNRGPQFAFVVSRDAGNAVVRNRIKRRLREAVRLDRANWPVPSVRMIFRVNDGVVADIPFVELQSQVGVALRSCGIDSPRANHV